MSDATITSPADKAAVTPLLSNDQINNAVATKVLSEINTGMTPAPTFPFINHEIGDVFSLAKASDSVSALQGDPARTGVLEAMAQKIESHDPSLGLVNGTVERDRNGNITGFEFSSPAEQSLFNQALNKDMSSGMTYKEAFSQEDANQNAVSRGAFEGIFHIDAPKEK